MRTHQEIDARSLLLARAVAEKIDNDPAREGLQLARENCARWLQRHPARAHDEWAAILQRNWTEVRAILLDETEYGQRLRQSNPFAGVLTPQERWAIYESFKHANSGT